MSPAGMEGRNVGDRGVAPSAPLGVTLGTKSAHGIARSLTKVIRIGACM